ncbi:MAG: response regulator [Anaerolineae bacterium]|nr:response regulator [Anaerolineae bacterium]
MQQSTETIRVLIVDDVAETRENLRKLLSFDPDIEVIGTAATGEQGIQLARELRPHVILMDINLPGIDGISATQKIVNEMPAAQIIILSVQSESGYMRKAMAAGARDFLVKPPSGDELVGTIRRVYHISKEQAARIAPSAAAVEQVAQVRKRVAMGHMVTVFAPKGGVGSTTVATNLAITLQRQFGTEKKVGVFDASLQFGDVGVMLNLQSNRSVADLTARTQELDKDMVTSAMTSHPSGIKVLLCPPHPEAADSLLASDSEAGGPGQSMRSITEMLRSAFDLVIVDTWSRVDDVTLSLLDDATLILLVITPTIPAIKSARLFLDVSFKLGYPREKICLVINHADRKTGLRVDQIEKALMPAIAHIPYDERAGLSAANRGIPLIADERTRTLAQSFARLAQSTMEKIQELTIIEEGEEEEDLESEASRRLLGRILG